jgi:hypothetical protein
MTEFEPDKFEEKYVHYFEELETVYSSAYQQLHGQTNSEVLRAIVATESQCTPDRTSDVQSVCKSFQLLLYRPTGAQRE